MGMSPELVCMTAENLVRPYEFSRKPPIKRLMYSDTSLTSYFSTSAISAVGLATNDRWQRMGYLPNN